MFIQIFNPTQNFSAPPNGALQSPLIDPTGGPMCFSFYYYIHGVDANRIELYSVIGAQLAQAQLIWFRKYPAGDMWHKIAINIPPQNTNFQVNIFVLKMYFIKQLKKFR
jgi:hypothetical protein